MQFDFEGARRAGFSDDQIADFLAPKYGFKLEEARKAGFSSGQIVDFLSQRKPSEPQAGAEAPVASLSGAEIGAPSDTAEAGAPADDIPSRTWEEALRDTGISARKAGATMLKIMSFATDMMNPHTASRRLAGGDTNLKAFSESVDEVVKELEQDYSEKRKVQGQQYDEADGFAESALFLLKNPTFVGDMIVESGVGTGVAGLAGRAAGRGVMAAMSTVERKLAGEAAEKGAAWAGGMAEALQTFGQVALDIEKSLDKNGVEDVGQRTAAMAAALPAAVATLAFGRLGGNVEGKLFGGSFADDAAGATVGSVLKTVGKDALKEGVVEEMPQSVGEQLFTNIGQRAAGDDVGITDGLGKAAASGLVVGAAQGGAISGVRGAVDLASRPTASEVQLTGDPSVDAEALATAPVTPVMPVESTSPAAPAVALQAGPELASPAATEIDGSAVAPTSPVPGEVNAANPEVPASITPVSAAPIPQAQAEIGPVTGGLVEDVKAAAESVTGPAQIQPADIVRESDGKPFGSEGAARLHAEDRGLSGLTPVEVGEGRWVLRRDVQPGAASTEAGQAPSVDSQSAPAQPPVAAAAPATETSAKIKDYDGGLESPAVAQEVQRAEQDQRIVADVSRDAAGDVTAVNVLNAALPRGGRAAVAQPEEVSGWLRDPVRRAVIETSRAFGAVFGKRVVFVRPASDGDALGFDGIVRKKSLPKHIFVDINSKPSALAIVGHELTHHIRASAPKLYAQLADVVRANSDVSGFVAGYRAQYKGDAAVAAMTDDSIEEEFVSNLVGNRILERETWDRLAAQNPDGFKALAQRVMGLLAEWIGKARKLKDTDERIIGDLEKVRETVAATLAEYERTQREQPAAPDRGADRGVGAGEPRVGGRSDVGARDDVRAPVGAAPEWHGREVQPDAVRVLGWHFGNVGGLTHLSGDHYGTGARGAEVDRVQGTPFAKRVNFYTSLSDNYVPTQEGGTGPHVYRVMLTNIYDIDSRTLAPRIAELRREGEQNALERAVVEAGYDGYLNKEHGSHIGKNPDGSVRIEGKRGAVVVLASSVGPVQYVAPNRFAAKEKLGKVSAGQDGAGVAYSRKEEEDGRDRPGAQRPDQATREDAFATVGGGRPAQGWDGATRIRSGDGKPLRVYRGAARDLAAADFADAALGVASGNPSSGLGVWFTTGEGEARTYAASYGGKTQSAFLDMRNPKVIKIDELQAFDSVEEAASFRRDLQARGFDGIIITGKHLGMKATHLVAFTPEAVLVDNPAFGEGDLDFTMARKDDAGINVEVAPNPDNAELTARFAALSYERRKEITRAVADEILPRVAQELGLPAPQIEYTVGGFEGASSPSMIVRAPGATIEQLEQLAVAMGRVLNQQAVISYDESVTEGENLTGFVSVTPSRELTDVEVDALYQHVLARVPEASGYTYRLGKLVFGNFSEMPDPQFLARIDGAIHGFELDGVSAATALHRFYSNYIRTDDEGDQTQAGAGGEALRERAGGLAALRREASSRLEEEISGRKAADREEDVGDAALSRKQRMDTASAISSRWGAPDVGMRMSLQDRAVSLDRFVYGDAPSPLSKSANQLDFARWWDAMAQQHGAVRSEMTPENRKALARILTYESLLALTKDDNAIGWYEGKVELALESAAALHPEIGTDPDSRFAFTLALAITSNGLDVPQNARLAFTVYEAFKEDGRMPEDIGIGTAASAMKSSFAQVNRLVEARGGMAGAREFLTSEFSVRELRKEGFAVDGMMDDIVYGGTIFGPKIGGGFLMNLNGIYDTLTIDRWNMRTWGRITGKMTADGTEPYLKARAKFEEKMRENGLEGDPEILARRIFGQWSRNKFANGGPLQFAARNLNAYLSPIAAPSSAGQRNFIRDVYFDTQRQLKKQAVDISIADLQALLWYPEKQLFQKFGVSNERAAPTDYAVEIARVVEDRLAQGRTVLGAERGGGLLADVARGRPEGGDRQADGGAPQDLTVGPDGSLVGDAALSRKQTGTPAFRKWFGDSKVVDKGGKPLVVYHGTGAEFTVFRPAADLLEETLKAERITDSTPWKEVEGLREAGELYFFAVEKSLAQDWAHVDGGAGKVMPVYLRVTNPAPTSDRDEAIDMLRDNPQYDGALVEDTRPAGGYGGLAWIVRKPTQIKSAVGNNGDFDPEKADITLSRKQAEAAMPDSVVRDDGGALQVVYTGTSKDVDFKSFKIPKSGAWFTEDAATASQYAVDNDSMNTVTDDYRTFRKVNTASRVMPVFLNITNPYTPSAADMQKMRTATNYRKAQGEVFDRARIAGHDGVDMGGGVWVVIGKPSQIKSAVGNSGNYDPAKADITLSRKTFDSVRDAVKYHIEAVTDSKRTFGLWDRTVGTQINKARKSPAFKRVYDKASEFIRDVSFFAAEAADHAPNLLPRLEGLASLGKGFLKTMTGERAATLMRVGRVVYEGTLNRRRFTDEELLRRGFTSEEAGLYREARNAVDRSLEITAVSTLHRMQRAMKLGVAGLRDMGLREARATVQKAIREKRVAIEAELQNLQLILTLKTEEIAKLNLSPEAVAQSLLKDTQRVEEAQRRIRELTEASDEVNDIAGRVFDLQNEGYFPLMRFGEYTVYATRTKPDGEVEQLFFGMYETEAERVKMAAALRQLHSGEPGVKIVEGVGNDEYYQLFSGINLDSLEVFAEALGASEKAVFQSYLKLAVANRSALKRMIARKDIAGFDQDVPRALAHFLTSNARLASRNYHWAEAKAAASEIPKENGDVQKEAVRLLSFIENPQEEAQTLRAVNFMWFMAGNLSTAALNLTQPVMTTLPYLSRFGMKSAMAALAKAAKTMTGRGVDPELKAAMRLAEERGITSPHEIHHLYGEQQRSLFSANTRMGDVWKRTVRLLGEPFALAEAANRHVTFVAAFEIGRKMTAEQLAKEGVKSAFDFAVKTVDDTQFVYHKANRPDWGRGSIQSLLMQFKTYSISTIELFGWLAKQGPEGKRAAAMMAAMWLLAAGLLGMPGEEDFEDLLDTIGQTMGWDTNLRATIRDNVYAGAIAVMGEELGSVGAEFALHGASALLPLDVQARLSLGNLVPGTGAFKRSQSENRGQHLAEVLGPSSGVLRSAMQALSAIQSGEGVGAAAAFAPNFLKNVAVAYDMAKTGAYRDAGGRVVTETTPLDAAVKAVGFQPSKVARTQRDIAIIDEAVKLQRVAEDAFASRIAKTMFEASLTDDPARAAKLDAKIDGIIAEVERWNERNPDTPIVLDGASIRRRVAQMSMTKEQRFLKSAPREMRGIIASQLEREEGFE